MMAATATCVVGKKVISGQETAMVSSLDILKILPLKFWIVLIDLATFTGAQISPLVIGLIWAWVCTANTAVTSNSVLIMDFCCN